MSMGKRSPSKDRLHSIHSLQHGTAMIDLPSTSMDLSAQTSSNRERWDELTPIHAQSGYYDLAGFRSGRLSLRSVEQEELGDVRGKSLLHLQCHFGQDTLSWARLGARVTGVDFSQPAIAL